MSTRGVLAFMLFLSLFGPIALAQDQPKQPNYFEFGIEDKNPPQWRVPADKRFLNDILRPPCLEFTRDYCMPNPGDGKDGFVCSGQTAVVVAYLRSLGLRAQSYYVDWTKDGTKEAHAMVTVPFLKGEPGDQKLCHHVVEAARKLPRHPEVEFECCHGKWAPNSDPAKSLPTEAQIQTSLKSCFTDHFKNLPKENPIARNGNRTVTAGNVDARPFCTGDACNAPGPIFSIGKSGDLHCTTEQCKSFQVAKGITIDQSRLKQGDPKTYGSTKIIINDTKSPEYKCKQDCNNDYCKNHRLNVPYNVSSDLIKASCPAVARYRFRLFHAGNTYRDACHAICADGGGQYAPDERRPEPIPVCREVNPVSVPHIVYSGTEEVPHPQGSHFPESKKRD